MDRKALLREIQRNPIEFVPAKMVVSSYPGEWTSPFEGKGYEPMGYREFTLGDDPRRMHMPATTRRGEPTIVERVALRDFKLMVVIDISPSMQVRSKLAIQLEAAALLLYSAWQAETTYAFALRTERGAQSFGLGIGSRHFYRLYGILWEICNDGETSRRGTPMHISRCLPPNSMLLYCSDFLGADGTIVNRKKLASAASRYDFVPIIVQDELEYGFPIAPYGSFIPLSNPETGTRREVWIAPKTAREIHAMHQARYLELCAFFRAHGVKPLHLDIPGVVNIRQSIDAYFRHRKRARKA